MKTTLLKIGRSALIVLAALAVGCAATFSMEWIARGSGRVALGWCVASPAPFLLTAVFYGSGALFLGLVTGRLWIGALASGTVSVILALVSWFKSIINGTPLTVEDFGLIGQLDQVMGVAGDLTVPGSGWRAIALLV